VGVRLGSKVHHVEVSVDLIVSALVVNEVAAPSEWADLLLLEAPTVLRLVSDAQLNLLALNVKVIVFFELFDAVGSEAIESILAMTLDHKFVAQVVRLVLLIMVDAHVRDKFAGRFRGEAIGLR